MLKALGNSVPAAAGKQKAQTFVMITRCLGLVDGVETNLLYKVGIKKPVEAIKDGGTRGKNM
jgi:hypothetical protein